MLKLLKKIIRVGAPILILHLLLLSNVPETHAAKLALSPAEATFKSGCKNSVSILINTEGADSNAVDAFLTYNPNEIEILGIGTGNVYQSYPGSQFGKGAIRITAFNVSGAFNGRGLLANINFQSKPGVQTSTINFNYIPGATTDSNVADLTATDVLNGVYNGTYNFVPGACTSDATPPVAAEQSPAPNAINVPLDSNINFLLQDTQGSGVDLNSIVVDVNGVKYTNTGDTRFKSTPKGNGYQISIKPIENFKTNEPVTVTINAKDKDGNIMQTVNYGFNESKPATECVPTAEGLRPAAPAKASSALLISFILLFLISALINIYLYMHGAISTKPIHFETHKINAKKRLKK